MNRYLSLLLLFPLTLRADVTKETYLKLRMLAGTTHLEQTTKTAIRSNMKSDDQTTKINVTFVQGKPQHQNAVTRLDKGIIWEINHNDKTYRELPIKVPESKTKFEGEVKGTPDTALEYRVAKSEFAVSKLDSSKTINGFACVGYVVKWILVIEEIKTKKQSTSIMTMRLWNTAPTDVIKQAEAEEAAFNQAYLAKLNLSLPPEQTQLMGIEYLMTLGISQDKISEEVKKAAAELAKIQGYPIVTEVRWEVPVSAEEKKPADSKSRGLPELSVGGLISKALEDKLTPKPQEQGVVFESYLEVKSIAIGPIPEKVFEVPEGYKKL